MLHLTLPELRRLLAAVDLKAPLGRRDYLLIVLGYHTGLRTGELASLDVGMVAHHGEPRHWLQVLSQNAKYRHSRIIPLDAMARAAIAKQLAFNQARGFSVAPHAPLFQNRFHERIPVRTIQFVVAHLRQKAGLDVQITPKSLRHSFASAIAQNTGSAYYVQALLGHRRIQTSMVYTHFSREALARAVDTLVRA